MTGWHDAETDKPKKSGYYIVEDRTGRMFRTWYESTIKGFDPIHDGIGYKLIRWREEKMSKKDLMEVVKRYGAKQYKEGYERGYKEGRTEMKLISEAVLMAYEEGYQAASAKALKTEQDLEADINRLKEEILRMRRRG